MDKKKEKVDTGNHQNLPPTRGVGYLYNFQGCLLPSTRTGTVQEVSEISCPGSDIPIQSSAFRSVRSTLGIHCNNKEVKPSRLVGERCIPPGLSPAYSRSGENMPRNMGWLVNLEKSELEPNQIFDFVGYQFDLRAGRVRPTPDRWQNLQDKILEILSLPACPVQQFMSLIGLLTATEKQIHLDRIHMRPIQWHLKNSWRVPESLEKGDSNIKVLAPTFTLVAARGQWPYRPTITPNNTCSANLYRRIKRRVGRSPKRMHCKRHLVPSGKQVAYQLPRTQAVFLALKEFQDLCIHKIVLVATDNTTVVGHT